jgi:hypothetical protein
LAAAAALCACVSDTVRETAVNVVTLQQGNVSELRRMRGRGPFLHYAVAPDTMLEVVEAAARRARGKGGLPVSAVFASTRSMEVIAKERRPADADDDGYGEPWLSAMVATVHPVEGEPGASRVEIHAVHRGPFHRGVVAWEASMPGWIAEELAARTVPRPRKL